MTSFLRINGIAVKVAVATPPGLTQKDIGDEHEAEDGTPIVNRRTTKRKWSFKTIPQAAASALALRDLVTGKGQVFSFENNNFYSGSGLAPTLVDAGATIENTNAKYGTYRLQNIAANKATWLAFTSTSPWTVAFWRSTDLGATWNHWVRTSAAGQWLNGVVDASSMANFLDVNTGLVTLGGPAAGSFDDVVMLPFIVPSDWPAQMAAYTKPVPDLPYLNADGLMIEQNASIGVLGIAGEMRAYATNVAKNLQDFAFSLQER